MLNFAANISTFAKSFGGRSNNSLINAFSGLIDNLFYLCNLSVL